MRAKTISASAWEVSTFEHPDFEIVSTFSAHLDATAAKIWTDPVCGSGQHLVTEHFDAGCMKLSGGKSTTWPEDEGWRTVRTAKPIFTNDYFVPSEPDYPIAAQPDKTFVSAPATFIPGTLYSAVAWGFDTDGGAGREIKPIFATSSVAGLPRAHAELLTGAPLEEVDAPFVIVPVVDDRRRRRRPPSSRGPTTRRLPPPTPRPHPPTALRQVA
jgi:hypothetical protein